MSSLIKETNENNIFETKFTSMGSIVMFLLTVALVLLGERVLYDVARSFTHDNIGSFGYFNNGQAILSHVFVVFPILVITFLLNYTLGQRKQKYAIILFPYFITSIILSLQLALELAWYFALNHNDTQFYLVMVLLVLTTTFAVYFVQNNYKTEKQEGIGNKLFVSGLILLGLFTSIILGFEKKQEEIRDSIQPFENSQTTESYPLSPPSANIPRIMYWPGKVNQHFDLSLSRWESDPDGYSGANIDKLEYCNKFYPGTILVREYMPETISTWRAAGNNGAYTGMVNSDLCIQ